MAQRRLIDEWRAASRFGPDRADRWLRSLTPYDRDLLDRQRADETDDDLPSMLLFDAPPLPAPIDLVESVAPPAGALPIPATISSLAHALWAIDVRISQGASAIETLAAQEVTVELALTALSIHTGQPLGELRESFRTYAASSIAPPRQSVYSFFEMVLGRATRRQPPALGILSAGATDEPRVPARDRSFREGLRRPWYEAGRRA